MYADRLYQLQCDLWEVCYVGGIVALGTVGYEDRVE